MKIAIQTLGCKVNQSESASIEGILRNNNYEIVKHTEGPDLYIINTCTVTAKSDYQSRQLIRRAAKKGAKVIATGCYTQLKPDELSQIDGINRIIGNSEKSRIIDHIQELSTKNISTAAYISPPEAPVTLQPYYSNRARAFLKIQDGCNFSCSYCTVPLARGKSRSLKPEDVMLAMNDLFQSGYREVVLTGIHIGHYGQDVHPQTSLISILKEITAAHPEMRIRLGSLEPQEFDFDILSLMKKGNVCSHLHIPLQSGSDRILKLMGRGYRTSYYKQLIHKIRTDYPDISIGADIIAGFPGETDEDFVDTLKFVDDLPISYLHVFPYSRRANTRASTFTAQVKEEIKKQRVSKLRAISEEKKINFMKMNLDRELDVIVESKFNNVSIYKVISDNYLRIMVNAEGLSPGQRLKIRVTELTDHVLTGKLIE